MEQQLPILCVGKDAGLQALRKKILASAGATTILASDLQEVRRAARTEELRGLIITSDLGWEEQCEIELAVASIRSDVPVLTSDGVVTPAVLFSFVDRINCYLSQRQDRSTEYL